MTDILSPGDVARLQTWHLEIAATILHDVVHRDEGADRRYPDHGGLVIHRKSGAWYCHADGEGGYSTVRLIMCMTGCTADEATKWARRWAETHPGRGSCDGVDDDDDDDGAGRHASAVRCREILAQAIEVIGTPGETYLRSRGLEPPYPDCVKYLPDARVGEGALVALLSARGRTTGAQLGYLDCDGRKSLVLPNRRRYAIEREPGAIFAVVSPKPGVADMIVDTVINEGVEDALSVATLGRPWRVLGAPGLGAVQHLTVRQNERIAMFRDGDVPGSPADKALAAAVDALLLQGAVVKVTQTPTGQDANSILQDKGQGALLALIAQAKPAELSIDGEVRRLARLDRVEYDRQRGPLAKKFGIRLSTLDDLVELYRPKRLDPDEANVPPPDEEWEGDVDLRTTLDAALTQVRRYTVAPDTNLATLSVWVARTHICFNDTVRLQKTPRLAIQSRSRGSGKTTTLEIVAVLSSRGRVVSSYTASSVLRGIPVRRRPCAWMKPTGCCRTTSPIWWRC
jgi:hypothetical protein